MFRRHHTIRRVRAIVDDAAVVDDVDSVSRKLGTPRRRRRRAQPHLVSLTRRRHVQRHQRTQQPIIGVGVARRCRRRRRAVGVATIECEINVPEHERARADESRQIHRLVRVERRRRRRRAVRHRRERGDDDGDGGDDGERGAHAARCGDCDASRASLVDASPWSATAPRWRSKRSTSAHA